MFVQKKRLSGEGLRKHVDDYLDGYCLIERDLTPKTIKGKRGTLNRVINFLDKASLNLETCRGYGKHLFERKWQPISIRSELKIIKAFARYLFDREHITEDWSGKIVLPKVRRKQLAIIPAELAEQAIIAGTNPAGTNHKSCRLEHREALQFVIRTGLRISELLKLKPGDINFENRTFVVQSKGRNTDLLPLPTDMIKGLERRKTNKRLFKVTAKTLNRCLWRGCQNLQIHSKVTVHSLRHIFCTELLTSGISLQVVSRLMRHSSVGVTDAVYSHYLVEDLSLALNYNHPLIIGGLDVDDMYTNIRKIFDDIGIIKNMRFITTIKQTSCTLNINIERK